LFNNTGGVIKKAHLKNTAMRGCGALEATARRAYHWRDTEKQAGHYLQRPAGAGSHARRPNKLLAVDQGILQTRKIGPDQSAPALGHIGNAHRCRREPGEGITKQLARPLRSCYVPNAPLPNRFFSTSQMADQIVITEKSSQANDVRAAVGSRYGVILPAEGHLFDLLEPEDVVPAWKRWSPILLRPEGLYGTRPAEGGNKASKLKAIREALRTAKTVWLATDCDREGQLIGQEILEHYEYRGRVMRVLFTAQDSQTIRDAFGRAKPNAEYASLYAAAVARRQADQIYNLSLTRTATVILGQGARRVIGVGRVKTPTLAIVCKRELEIRNFVPIAYFEVVATAKVAGGQFQTRHAPQDRIVRREIAEAVANAAQGFEAALAVRVEDKRQGPPKLHDLPSLQKICGSRFGWPASKTLEVAQELYDGQGKKIITYPRAEVRYLPQSLITDVPRIVAGLRVGQSFSAIPVPEPPVIRKGASGTFYDKGLAGASHHAIIPNVNMIDKLRDVWPRLSSDENHGQHAIFRSARWAFRYGAVARRVRGHCSEGIWPAAAEIPCAMRGPGRSGRGFPHRRGPPSDEG
jgi:hypothetical protein